MNGQDKMRCCFKSFMNENETVKKKRKKGKRKWVWFKKKKKMVCSFDILNKKKKFFTLIMG